MRSRIAVAGAALITTAALAGGVSPAHAASSACQAGTTLEAGKSARIFVVKSGSTRKVYGCASGQKKRSYLGRQGGEGVDTSVIAVKGPRVAYVRTSCAETGCQQSVFVRDLKKRTDLTSAAAAPADAETKVVDLVLSTKGTVAWIGEVRADGSNASARFVFARKPGSALLPIAAGLNIAPGTLALSRTDLLYWSQMGQQSIVLP